MVSRRDQWSQKYDKCKDCGKTKFKHKCRGLCTSCYHKEQRRKIVANKLKNDKKAREIIGRPLEWDDKRIEKEADDLLEWSAEKDNLVLEKFGLYRDPPYIRDIMYKLCAKSEVFRRALLIAKERLRTNKEEGAYTGKYSKTAVLHMHGFQDRKDNDKDVSFTEYKKDLKIAEKKAEAETFALSIIDSKNFIDEAKKRLSEEES